MVVAYLLVVLLATDPMVIFGAVSKFDNKTNCLSAAQELKQKNPGKTFKCLPIAEEYV